MNNKELASEIAGALVSAGIVESAEVVEPDTIGAETEDGERFFLRIEGV
jgi:hypothetical protein